MPRRCGPADTRLIESGFELPAKHFAISVAGYDGAGTARGVNGRTTGRIRALLAAPRGTLSFADHVRATGAFAAFDVAIGSDARIEYEDGFAASAPSDYGAQKLSGYLTAPIIAAPIVGPVPASEVISIAVGLPVLNPAALRSAAQQVSDPTSPQFPQIPDAGASLRRPTAPRLPDYQNLNPTSWAKAKGLTIDKTYPNRMLLDVSGTAAQVEQALFIGLNLRAASGRQSLLCP